MTVQHEHSQVETNIYILGADGPNPSYMACFGRLVGEPPEVTEERWNRLAERFWAWGLEPPEDEPWFTIVEDGVVWDHYTLQPINYDERPLNV